MEITLRQGQNLWEALKEQGMVLDRPCGGRGTCGGCEVIIDGIGRVKACQFTEEGVYAVSIPDRAAYDIVQPGREMQPQEQLYIAVDIGTTTVALQGVCGLRTASDGFINPQRVCGADVVSRIQAANTGQGSQLQTMLKTRLLEALEHMRIRLDPEAGRCRVMIAANTTMLHLLRGFSCEGLGHAPFTPVDIGVGNEVWKEKDAVYEVTYLPGISAYVGADIVSGIYALHMAESAEVSLLLDLGTNGEMVIGSRQRLLCASAAAGPAFEGGRLSLSLHASGMLALLNRMYRQGVMDAYGLLADPYFEQGYPFGSGEEQRITQEDIRELQMAKGAIRAGIHILLKEYGIAPEQVAHIYLAGGMGYYLNPEDAIGIGLLPEAFAGRIQSVGNTALAGICRMAQVPYEDAMRLLLEIAADTEEIILAQHPDFEEAYINGMNFAEI